MHPNFLKIDPLRLDKEWLGQATLYFEYSQQLADARKEADAAKVEMDLTQSELELKIRENPTKFGLKDKPTEANIKAAIPSRPRYKEAQAVYFNARHKVDVLTGAVVAIEHRKRALTMLVDLHRCGYFADPKNSASADARESMAEEHKKAARSAGKTTVKDLLADDED